MRKDFAGRASAGKTPSRSKPANKKGKRQRTTGRASPAPRVLFHGPSFSSGAIVGALVVVIAAYAPEFLAQRQAVAAPSQPTPETPARDIVFDFPRLLEEVEVKVDPLTYAVPEPDPNAAPPVYEIQAASFRDNVDADQLRAELLLENLPARVVAAAGDSRWYRVRVGPFERRVEADRAMTRLRERGLDAILINKHN